MITSMGGGCCQPLALSAMMRSRWLYSVALLTPPHPLFQSGVSTPTLMSLGDILCQVLDPSLRARVNCTSPVIAPPNTKHTAIEP